MLTEELLPLYREVAALYHEHHGILEPSTRELYQRLISFIDLWERKGAPPSTVHALQSSGEAADPAPELHDEVKRCVDRIIWVMDEKP